MYIFKAIKSNSYIKQDNTIFEHTHHTQSLQNRPMFKDGIVVVNSKILFTALMIFISFPFIVET